MRRVERATKRFVHARMVGARGVAADCGIAPDVESACQCAQDAAGLHTADVKLVIAIVHSEDSGRILDGLMEQEFRATRLQSAGGFLKKTNATVLVGVEESAIDTVIAIIRRNSSSRTHVVDGDTAAAAAADAANRRKVDVRGAVVFVVD